MDLITVKLATELILKETRDFGEESIPFLESAGRVLAEDISADRDFPPFDRVTMDGFAIRGSAYENGTRHYKISGTQFAGDPAFTTNNSNEAVEVMTGTPVPFGADSVIRVEDTDAKGAILNLPDGLEMKKNIHKKGTDRKEGDIILKKGHTIKTPDLSVLATVGKVQVQVKKKPQVAVITSGDELVDVTQKPEAHQIRKSNIYAISELIKPLCDSISHFHLPDSLEITKKKLGELLETFDVLVLSGGVSAGKKDYMPEALKQLGVQKLFHKIQQRPGKPMWFGKKDQTVIFALPGNPVSTFMCAVRYVKPWLEQSLGIYPKPEYAVLDKEIIFRPALSYFMQVSLSNENGTLTASPNEGHGSGDLANLSDADAFMELELREGNVYAAGEVFRVWRY